MRGKLSAAESRYRIKLIQEKHYDKKKQKQLDMFAKGKKGIYKEIYQAHRNKKPHLFFCYTRFRRIHWSFRKFYYIDW